MKLSRRNFLRSTGLAALGSAGGCVHSNLKPDRVWVNDVHTRLNRTSVRGITGVRSLDELTAAVVRATREHRSLAIAGGRHAGGGQQFATGAELIDTRELRRVLRFDAEAGRIEVESGMQWPELMDFLIRTQNGAAGAWAIAQKQTGTDRLSIGGALAANAHGRGLRLPPIIANVESFVLVDAGGNPRQCSRSENADLFKLVIGGYGLFGFIYSVTLRLVPRQKLRRVVNVLEVEQLPDAFSRRIAEGALHGDFQFAIDSHSSDFLRRGILSCYLPATGDTRMPVTQKKLSEQDWRELIHLAHTDPGRAFERYAEYYIGTSGQIYWSDTQYAAAYVDGYHEELDGRLGARGRASEVIGELYVPRDALPRFLDEARDVLRRGNVPVIYGTIRLIEQDTESFLAWARQPYACVIFNLHTPHTKVGIGRTAACFRELIDRAIQLDGSFYLTYHRFASREQVEACYPQFREFLRLKKQHDPAARFQSDWYRHFCKLFGRAAKPGP